MSEFKREARYIVVKPDCEDSLRTERLKSYIDEMCFKTPDCVVVEADWPEYEPVWRMIESRVMGLPNELEYAQSELAALREELAILKSPGPLCFCGLKQTKNPHPEAGVPPGYLEVGTVYDCIPCLNKSRRAWSKKANALTSELAETQRRLADAERRNARYESLLRQIIPCLAMSTNSTAPTYIRQITEALPQPTESGASE